jgi:diphthamide biosynthesis protein 2
VVTAQALQKIEVASAVWGALSSLPLSDALHVQAGKKTYTLLMGKPNPAKLANFPEIEVFVMLADPQGLILDSKEYLNPIITPHEAFLAFTGKDFDAAHYR